MLDGYPTNGVLLAEHEDELEGLVDVERVGVKHLDVQGPGLKVIGRDKSDASGEGFLDLY